MIKMCQCKLNDCNRCTTVVQDVNSMGGFSGSGQVVCWNLLYFAFNFAVNLKLLQKNKACFLKT